MRQIIKTGTLSDVIADVQVFDLRMTSSANLEIVFKLDVSRRYFSLSRFLAKHIQVAMRDSVKNGTLGEAVDGYGISLDEDNMNAAKIEGFVQISKSFTDI